MKDLNPLLIQAATPILGLAFVGALVSCNEKRPESGRKPAVAQSSVSKGIPEMAQDVQSPHQIAFLRLSERDRANFMTCLREAKRLFEENRIPETLVELGKATAIFEDSPEVHNLRGGCYVSMRKFEEAEASFHEAALLAKDNSSIEFNIGEVFFVTKQWQKAHDLFVKISKRPQENFALSRLVAFKILLCKIQLGNAEDAVALAGKYDIRDNSPIYFFANAALAFGKMDMREAHDLLTQASVKFPEPEVLAPWQDTLIECGYLPKSNP